MKHHGLNMLKELLATLGHAEVNGEIGIGVYKVAAVVYLSVTRQRPNFIIGADFLATHNCDLSLH